MKLQEGGSTPTPVPKDHHSTKLPRPVLADLDLAAHAVHVVIHPVQHLGLRVDLLLDREAHLLLPPHDARQRLDVLVLVRHQLLLQLQHPVVVQLPRPLRLGQRRPEHATTRPRSARRGAGLTAAAQQRRPIPRARRALPARSASTSPASVAAARQARAQLLQAFPLHARRGEQVPPPPDLPVPDPLRLLQHPQALRQRAQQAPGLDELPLGRRPGLRRRRVPVRLGVPPSQLQPRVVQRPPRLLVQVDPGPRVRGGGGVGPREPDLRQPGLDAARAGGRVAARRGGGQVEEGAPGGRVAPPAVGRLGHGAQVPLQVAAALLRQLRRRDGRLEPRLLGQRLRRRAADQRRQLRVEGVKVRVALLYDEGAQRQPQGDVVERVGLGLGGRRAERGRRDGYFDWRRHCSVLIGRQKRVLMNQTFAVESQATVPVSTKVPRRYAGSKVQRRQRGNEQCQEESSGIKH
ncbi:uncharacterized protein E0L32_005773 [Thyridium curvatum]|uniref:Uncharacterized protein n=1 Tax=Thyridium curvatum TaxID=1093900 RepID=A0A507B8W2_9PEZI|nr:uncharacterized protein E0L32_005773 [Thyridium curvatum]TPX13829.1 hypothetical protein E0L32_005773 [Thyridium curvatum]